MSQDVDSRRLHTRLDDPRMVDMSGWFFPVKAGQGGRAGERASAEPMKVLRNARHSQAHVCVLQRQQGGGAEKPAPQRSVEADRTHPNPARLPGEKKRYERPTLIIHRTHEAIFYKAGGYK